MISPRIVFLLHYKKFFLFIIVFVNIFHVYSSDGYQKQIDGHYDLIVIGGGSAGLSCAKEAAKHNKSVVVLDYVIPSPRGTSWGIGGTCVNAGCIPKKLYHHAANLKKEIRDSEFYGWNLNGDVQDIKNSWIKLRNSVQDYIKSVRWKIRRDLNNMNIKFIQGLGSFIDKNTVRAMVIKNYPKFAEELDHKNETLRGNNILIAVGSRPFYPRIPTDLKNYCITSDDIFYLENPPGKTVVIGAGYIGLEFAGFLNGLGFPTTVIVRNNLLKDFDQQMVQLVKDDMEEEGVTFCIKCEVQSVKAVNYTTHFNPSGVSYVVRWLDKNNDKLYEDVFHTIICATGRKPTTNFLDLDQVGVNYDRTTGKIFANNEETNVPHIYAAGDVLLGVPELTPSAIQAGQLLGKRLFGNGHQKMDYTNIPSTVFTPLEYGFVGLSEESAIVKYGLQSVEVYHGYYYPLEWEIPRAGSGGIDSKCYLKVITLRHDDKIIGIHFTGPHAGDVIQGFAVAMKNGLTVHGLQNSVGIHPTIAEEFTRLSITKRSGLNPKQLSCCS